MEKTSLSLLAAVFLTQLYLGEALVYTASPGLQTHDQHQDVTLSWKVSGAGVENEFWTIYLYHKDLCVIRMSGGNALTCYGTQQGLLFVNDTHVDYTVEDVSLDDAGQYSCSIHIFTIFNDSNAALYVFDTPDTPLLSPSGPNHEDDQFTLLCHAASTSLPAVNRSKVNMVYTWRNNSKDLDTGDLPERYNITSSGDPANAVNDLLVITDLSRHDAGSYTCYWQEDGSNLQSPFSNIYNLEPLYAPGPASPGEDQTADVGNDVTLSCSADYLGRPDGSWIWTRPGGDEVNTSDVGQLTIAEVTVMNDDGEYSCRLNNQVGDGARGNYMTVTVKEKPSLDTIEDISLTNTEQLNVSCKAKARPMSNIIWKYANDSSLLPSVFTWSSTRRPYGKYNVTTSYLQWTASSSPDDRRHTGGIITCVASNVVDVTATDFMLDVQFAPYKVQVNLSAEIIEYERLGPVLCSASCNPPCSYSWYKKSAPVSSNEDLMIPNVTRDAHGIYECRPKNGIYGGQTADFYLTVFYGPSVDSYKVNTPADPIKQHDDVTFSCQTDSRPASVITLIRPSGDTLVSSSTSNTLELTLTDINCLDSGSYRCEANNSRTGRKDYKLLPIEVQCPPRKHATSDVKVGAAEGDTVTFSITAIAYPQPSFMWFFNRTELPDQSYVTTTTYSRGFVPNVFVNSSLIRSNVTRDDFGNYSVKVSNLLGDMEDVVYSLIPAGKPTAPSQLGDSHSNAVSIMMQWTSEWNRGEEQVFTLMYRRSDSDDSYTNITDISDPGQGDTVTAKARNLTSDKSYNFIAVAHNQYGFTQSQLASAITAAQPGLGSENDGGFSIDISGDMATIIWSLHRYRGPITHVYVNSCVSDCTKCITTKVSLVTSKVAVTVPEGGSSYTFEFLVYDGEDLILGLTYISKVDSGQTVRTIVGVVIAVLLLAVVTTSVGVITMKRRRRRSSGGEEQKKTEARESNDKQDDSSVPVVHYENVRLHGRSDLLPQSESDEIPVPAQNEYEFLQHSQIPSDVSATHYEALRPVNNISGTTNQAFNYVELSEYANINLMSGSNSGV